MQHNLVSVTMFVSPGEMWVGVTLAVAVELVPSQVRTSAVAVYLFIITNIGGNIPLLVPPITKSFEDNGFTKAQSLRGMHS